MNGAQLLLNTAARAGMDVCFANFGTTEVSLVAALDQVPDIRGIMCRIRGSLHRRGRMVMPGCQASLD